MKVILIGYRAAGKTTVGRQLARRLGLPFYDTDEMVKVHTGKTIKEIVDDWGWNAFRRKEQAVIKGLSGMEAGGVLSVGGGAVMDAENRDILSGMGWIICLAAEEWTIRERMENDDKNGEQRPPLLRGNPGEEISTILKERISVYGGLAHKTIHTDGKPIPAIVEEICGYLEKQKGVNHAG